MSVANQKQTTPLFASVTRMRACVASRRLRRLLSGCDCRPAALVLVLLLTCVARVSLGLQAVPQPQVVGS